jgi:hypothetical protein
MSLIDSLPAEEARATQVNWENVLKTIVDAYPLGISHGVQKDAIQNGWDARRHKLGHDWGFGFALHERKGHVFLTMTDWGTHGLTGRILRPAELQEDLPPEERWGRFENLAFMKDPSEDAIGARGQGKFVFVAASKRKCIVYDTLRRDRVYRLGVRVIRDVSRNDCWSREEEEALEWLEKFDGSLSPLGEIGTRVIIDDPVDELIEDITSGAFLQMIGETWWEIMQKFNARITVKCGGQTHTAKIPSEMQLAEEDTANRKVWIRKNDVIPLNGGGLRVKRLHAEFVKDRVLPEHMRGIALQRGHMKVCSEAFQYAPRDIAHAVSGYIEFDRELDQEMKAFEDPTHYHFLWRKKLPQLLRQYIQDQLQEFGRQKLGLGVSAEHRRREHQSEAEKKALHRANQVAKELGIAGVGPGTRRPRVVTPTPRGQVRPIRLRMSEAKFPRDDSLRVNRGESIKDISCTAVNDSDDRLKIRVRLYVLRGDDQILDLCTRDVSLKPNSESDAVGPFEIEIDDRAFAANGKYVLRARMLSLDCPSHKKGDILDEEGRVFYVEEDPPQGGLFERLLPVDFPDKFVHWRGDLKRGEARGWVYQYNLRHNEKIAVGDQAEPLSDYLFKLLAEAMVEIDLGQPKPKLFKEEDLESPKRVAEVSAQQIGRILHDYYQR